MAGGRYRVVVADQARQDRDEIAGFVSRESPDAASKMVDQLSAWIRTLEALPQRYIVGSSGRETPKAVRRRPGLPYLIYYRVLKRQGIVRVLTIRQGGRGQPKRFPA